MKLGRLEEGWPLYEYRFAAKKLDKSNTRGIPETKLWTGKESIHGKTILVCCEQGLGDTIQFCRYAEQLSESGAKVILEAQPSLVNLLKTLKGVDEIITGADAPRFDVFCSIMSLPLAFKTTLDAIPCGDSPYLYPDRDKVALWEKRLGGENTATGWFGMERESRASE